MTVSRIPWGFKERLGIAQCFRQRTVRKPRQPLFDVVSTASSLLLKITAPFIDHLVVAIDQKRQLDLRRGFEGKVIVDHREEGDEWGRGYGCSFMVRSTGSERNSQSEPLIGFLFLHYAGRQGGLGSFEETTPE